MTWYSQLLELNHIALKNSCGKCCSVSRGKQNHIDNNCHWMGFGMFVGVGGWGLKISVFFHYSHKLGKKAFTVHLTASPAELRGENCFEYHQGYWYRGFVNMDTWIL